MARKTLPSEISLSSIGVFPTHWETSTLNRACALVTDGTHDSPKVAQHGYPLVTGKCITGGRLKLEEAYLISEADHRAVIARSKAEFGDILFANIGNSIGELARVEIDEEFSIKNVALFKPSKRVESLFLKYYLGSPAVKTYIRGNTFGSAQPFIGLGTLRSFPIPLPPLPEQKAIAHILGSLDDKIELNRQMNATLESMAQALFKSWFVDFDPVIDNALAAGNPIPEPLHARAETRNALGDKRKPLPDAIQKQFPSRFFFNEEMGWVPEGWEVGPLSQLAQLNPEGWTAKNHPEMVNYVDLANVKNGRINERVRYRFTEAPSRARRILRRDDTIIGTVRPGNRSFALIHEHELTGSTGFAVMRPKEEPFRSYIYLALTREDVIQMFAHLADGAAYPAIRPDVVAGHLVTVPPANVFKVFDRLVYPWLLSIGESEAMSDALSQLRDTLLPKLLSGQLRVPEAEKLMADAL